MIKIKTKKIKPRKNWKSGKTQGILIVGENQEKVKDFRKKSSKVKEFWFKETINWVY